MKYGLDHKTIEKISGVLSSYAKIERVLIYGSRAKGDFSNGSDIDFSELTKLATQLDDLMLPYKIDISLYHQISNPDLIDHIERVGLVFYES